MIASSEDHPDDCLGTNFPVSRLIQGAAGASLHDRRETRQLCRRHREISTSPASGSGLGSNFADFSPVGHLYEAFFLSDHVCGPGCSPFQDRLPGHCPENSLSGEHLFRDPFLCPPSGRHYALLLDHLSRSSRDQGVRQRGGLSPRSPSQVSFFAGEGSWKHNRCPAVESTAPGKCYRTSPWLGESCRRLKAVVQVERQFNIIEYACQEIFQRNLGISHHRLPSASIAWRTTSATTSCPTRLRWTRSWAKNQSRSSLPAAGGSYPRRQSTSMSRLEQGGD